MALWQVCVCKHLTWVQRLTNSFLNQITSYLEFLLSTSYLLLGLEYSPQVMRRSDEAYTEQNFQEALWSLTNVLIVQAPRRGCSPASIPYLGSQCLWWLEATVPSTQVCHLPSPSAHDLATLLWDWVLYLGDCKEVGSLPLESPWDSQSPNLPSVLQFRDGLLSLEGTRELERAASVPTPPNIKLISLQWGPFPF